MQRVILAMACFFISLLVSMTLLVRLVYRYNAPIMRTGRKRKKDVRGAFTAKISRQEKVENGDYYIVEYVWQAGKRQRAYACRVLSKPPEEIRLKSDWLGRLTVVDGPVNRMDNRADPFIAYAKNPFPKAGYLLVLVPIAAAVLCCVYLGIL